MSQNINTVDISNDANLEDYVLVSVNGSLRRVKVANLKDLVDSTEDVVVVDTELSTTSVNPVQNKVITTELNKKANSSDMSTYQTKTDNTLTTTSKEVVGAINENTTSINQLSGGKADKSEVNELKEELVNNEDLFNHAISNEYNIDFNVDSNALEKFKNINLLIEYQYGKFDVNGYKYFTNFIHSKIPLEAGKYSFINNTGLQYSVVKPISDTVGEYIFNWRTNNILDVTFDSVIYINFAKLDNSDFKKNDIYNIKKNFKIVKDKETISLSDIERLQCKFNPKFKDYEFVSLLNYPHTFVSKVGVSQKDKTKLFQTNKFCYKFSSASKVSKNNEFRLNLTAPLNLNGIQEFIMIAYIPDELYMDSISLIVEKDDNSPSWNRTNHTFTHGWNFIHFYTADGNITTWNTTNLIRVQCSYIDDNSIADVYVSDIIAVKPQKAKLIFVEDHGYSTFYKEAYPRLKQLNIPVTWGINPGILGSPAGQTTKLTQSEIDEIANDSNSEFSFHSWDTTATKNMTSDEIKNDVQKCITYLKKHGLLPQYFWRCAWVQNQAVNASASKYILPCYATPTSNAGFTNYPFVDKYNIPRTQLHGNNDFTNMFDTLKKTHCAIVVYTHDLSESGGIHIKEDEFSAFLNSASSAISEGWLEPTTYNRLCVKYGDNEQIIIN